MTTDKRHLSPVRPVASAATDLPPVLPEDTDGRAAAAGWATAGRYGTAPVVVASVAGPDVTVRVVDRVVVVAFGGEEEQIAPAVVPSLVEALVHASEGPRTTRPETTTVAGWGRDLTVTARRERRRSPDLVALRAKGPRATWTPDRGPRPRASRVASVLDAGSARRVAAVLLVQYWTFVVPRFVPLDDSAWLLRAAVADVLRAGSVAGGAA